MIDVPKEGADWRPTASLDTLRIRAELLAEIRVFFRQRSVLEVETPILARATVTDPHIESLQLTTSPTATGDDSWYLHTSPEFAMKRLLASGSGDIFQVARVFRQGEMGRLHNPEFSMLEWYRLDYDHHHLMDEVDELLQYLFETPSSIRMSYEDVFQSNIGLNPHEATLDTLIQCACDLGIGQELLDSLNERDQWLDLLMSGVVGPKLGHELPVFIYDFPASQAALAKVGSHGLAERFELFIDGVEIANGYNELTNAKELSRRFRCDNALRKTLGASCVDIDDKLLAAMQHGLPTCAGVAVGLDRLLAWKMDAKSLAEVMSFTAEQM